MIGRACLFVLPASIPAYLLTTFMPSYLVTRVHLSNGQALLLVTIAVLAAMITQPIAGRLSDRLGRRPMLVVLCVVQLALAYPVFLLFSIGGLVLPLVGLIVIGVIHGIGTGCQSAPMLESFPTRTRFTGYALALGLSTALVAGPTPYVATWLIEISGSSFAPAWLIMGLAIPSLICAFFVRESSNRPLPMS
jgi:MHS family proline/betaine transporter-like MFS transporter